MGRRDLESLLHFRNRELVGDNDAPHPLHLAAKAVFLVSLDSARIPLHWYDLRNNDDGT